MNETKVGTTCLPAMWALLVVRGAPGLLYAQRARAQRAHVTVVLTDHQVLTLPLLKRLRPQRAVNT
jgi:hypothetical protein